MHTLPQLQYEYNALEPFIDEQTMHIHHTKHHQAYIDKLNTALEGLKELASLPVEELLQAIDEVPEDKRQAVINHGGGHANHSLFWQTLTPKSEQKLEGQIIEQLEKKFGNMDLFKDEFAKTAMSRFGSGWSWLVLAADNSLHLISTPNQDSPLLDGHIPLLGLDVWEHAYYLKYQNRRQEYIDAWWNVVNWAKVEELFVKAWDKDRALL